MVNAVILLQGWILAQGLTGLHTLLLVSILSLLKISILAITAATIFWSSYDVLGHGVSRSSSSRNIPNLITRLLDSMFVGVDKVGIKKNGGIGGCRSLILSLALSPKDVSSEYVHMGNFLPPKHDLSFSGIEEFVNEPIVSEPTIKKPVVETSEAKASADKPKVVRKNNSAPIIEDWVFDSEEEDVPQAKKEKKTVKSSFAKIEFVKSKEQAKSPRKTVNQCNQNRLNIHSPRGNQRN
ncbi:hypothetical protein Tco_0798138 [Tanacetum coccineum]